MTEKYSNIFINDSAVIAGPYEKNFCFDKVYKDLYFNENSWEKAESKISRECVEILLKKSKISKNDIDVIIGGDLLNQISASNYAFKNFNIPFIGIYSACATSVLSIILGAHLVKKNIICVTSSHNCSAEKQFRYPVEYGAPRKETSTFTSTGSASVLLSKRKSKIKLESSTIGKIIDSFQNDVNNMGAVMAIAAADTIYRHLKDMKRDIDYYDLILTGDLGKYGKEILKEYLYNEYKIKLINYEDAGVLLLPDKNAGGSGPAALPLIAYTDIFKQMKEGKLKKVLLVATGALMSMSMNNQKETIPSIAHAISLESVI